MMNSQIIRHRPKIASAINNAKRFMDVQAEFGSFTNYIWRFVDGKPKDNGLKSLENAPSKSPESDRLAKDLKMRGFKFLGSTTLYAHMQATGLVNDHWVQCFRYEEVKSLVEGEKDQPNQK